MAPWTLILQEVLEGHPWQSSVPAWPPMAVLPAQTCPQLAEKSVFFPWLVLFWALPGERTGRSAAPHCQSDT